MTESEKPEYHLTAHGKQFLQALADGTANKMLWRFHRNTRKAVVVAGLAIQRPGLVGDDVYSLTESGRAALALHAK
jgi:hypothetical protein